MAVSMRNWGNLRVDEAINAGSYVGLNLSHAQRLTCVYPIGSFIVVVATLVFGVRLDWAHQSLLLKNHGSSRDPTRIADSKAFAAGSDTCA